MVHASQPETQDSTGRMVLGVQCACRVVPWKDRVYSIEPCSLHAHADDLLEALKEARDALRAVVERPSAKTTPIAVADAWSMACAAIERVKS